MDFKFFITFEMQQRKRKRNGSILKYPSPLLKIPKNVDNAGILKIDLDGGIKRILDVLHIF